MSNLQEFFNGLPPVSDRRLNARVTPRSLVDVVFGDTKAIVINLSESGMALAVGNPPAATNCLIRIRFQLPTNGQTIEIFARVVRPTKSRKGVGVRLIGLTTDAREEIANWIASERSASDLRRSDQILQRSKKALEISTKQTKRIYSNPAAENRDEKAVARFATIFPSEGTYVESVLPAKEKAAESALGMLLRADSNADGSVACGPDRSVSQTSEPIVGGPKILDGPLSINLISPTTQASPERSQPLQARAPFTGFGWQARNDKASAKGSSRSYIFDLTGPQLAALVYVFALIGLGIGIAATKASVDVLTDMGYGPFAKHVRVRPPSPSSSPIPQMPAAPPPDLASKEWALNVKPGAPPSPDIFSQPTTDQTNTQAANLDSAKENSQGVNASPSGSEKRTATDTRAGTGWDFQSEVKQSGQNSESKSAEATPSQSAQQAAAPNNKEHEATQSTGSNLKTNEEASDVPESADAEKSASRKVADGFAARGTPQRSVGTEHPRSVTSEDETRNAARNRSIMAKNAVPAEARSSAATNQKRAHPAVEVSPMRRIAKNRARLAVKSGGDETEGSSATSSKRSGRAAGSTKSGKRDDSTLLATKSGPVEPTMASSTATKRQHLTASKAPKGRAARESHIERAAKSSPSTSHAEHVVKSEELRKSKTNAAAKKEHAVPVVTAKSVTPAKPESASAKSAAKNKKTPTPSQPAVAEKAATPTTEAPLKKTPPEGPSRAVADLVSPASPKEGTASSAPSATPKTANPVGDASPKNSAPEDLTSPAPKPSAPPAANPVAPNPVLSGDSVSVPSKPGKPQRVTFPQKQIADSSSLAISSQLSVVVPAGSAPTNQSSHLQAGKLLSYVMPHNPRPGDHYGADETVKVLATVGQQGFVTDIKPVSGPIFLLSSTMSAVRLWRYKPTFLNGTPVETHQDVIITFKLAR